MTTQKTKHIPYKIVNDFMCAMFTTRPQHKLNYFSALCQKFMAKIYKSRKTDENR